CGCRVLPLTVNPCARWNPRRPTGWVNAGASMTMKDDDLRQALKARFDRYPQRHAGIDWADVQTRLEQLPDALAALRAMEDSGGEPDVIGRDREGRLLFCDCSPESPKGRRSRCYDREALAARKEHKPASSALEEAAAMGIE